MSDHNFTHYFIVEDVSTATSVIDALKQEQIKDDNIGVVSKDSDIVLADLPQADFSETSNLPESLKRGAMLGSASGLLAGVILSVFPLAGVTLGGAAILGMTTGGAALGAWSASMIGISENSPLVERFENSIDNKKTLIFCKLSESQATAVFNGVSQIVAKGEIEKGQIS